MDGLNLRALTLPFRRRAARDWLYSVLELSSPPCLWLVLGFQVLLRLFSPCLSRAASATLARRSCKCLGLECMCFLPLKSGQVFVAINPHFSNATPTSVIDPYLLRSLLLYSDAMQAITGLVRRSFPSPFSQTNTFFFENLAVFQWGPIVISSTKTDSGFPLTLPNPAIIPKTFFLSFDSQAFSSISSLRKI